MAASTIKSLRGFGAYNLFNEVYLTEFCLRGFGCIHNLNPYTDLFPSSSNSTKNLDSYFSLSPNLSPPFVAPIPQTSQASPVNSSSVPLIPPSQLFMYLVPPLLLHPSLFSHKILSLLTLLHLLQSLCLYPTLSQSIPTLCKQGLNLVFTLHFFSLILSLKL